MRVDLGYPRKYSKEVSGFFEAGLEYLETQQGAVVGVVGVQQPVDPRQEVFSGSCAAQVGVQYRVAEGDEALVEVAVLVEVQQFIDELIDHLLSAQIHEKVQ